MFDYDYLFKIILVGNADIGKTSMLSRFVDDVYSENYVSTIGVDFKIKMLEVNKKDIKMQIWDTAGQDRFRTITSTYYRGSHGIVIAFDITDKESFSNINTWLAEVNRYVNDPQIIYMLIGCKSDLEAKRVIPYETAAEYAENNGMLYFEISAKTGKNIDIAFESLTVNMIAKSENKNNRLQLKSDEVQLLIRTNNKQNSCCLIL